MREQADMRRTPQGVRGLKQVDFLIAHCFISSHSARSAWIETVIWLELFEGSNVALRKECVD